MKLSWKGDLTNEQKDALNDVMNLMGMQAAADEGLIPQSKVDEESARLELKYKDV